MKPQQRNRTELVQEDQQILLSIEEKIETGLIMKETPKEKEIPQKKILLSLVNKNKTTDGCLLMFSNFDHSYIWRKLTFLNCKVIGLRQY